jgi:hypothetical protein
MIRTQPRPSRAAIDASMRAQSPQGQSLRIDLWIARRLGRPDLYSGVTIPSERMERQRREIVRQGLDDHRVVGASTETWAQLFERVHGEVL